MKQKSVYKIKMTSTGIWSLVEGTPGILEVHELPSVNDNDYVEFVLGDGEPLNRSQVASKLLDTLEGFNYDVDEPAFPDWLGEDEKVVDLPIFEDLQPLSHHQSPSNQHQTSLVHHQQQAAPQYINQTSFSTKYDYPTLSRSGGSVKLEDNFHESFYSPPHHGGGTTNNWQCIDQLDVVNSQLTPPHSPTMYEASSIKDVSKTSIFNEINNKSNKLFMDVHDSASIINKNITLQNLPQQQHHHQYPQLSDSEPLKEEIISLLQGMNPKEIDELVAQHVENNFVVPKDLVLQDENTQSSEILSPENSSSSSISSDDHSDYSSDPDYSPNSPVYNRQYTKNTNIIRSTENTRKIANKRNSSNGTRTKPYARKNNGTVIIEDKKLRKKEQNKNAATRYRMKKKQEIEVILSEEKEIEDRHEKLQKQEDDLKREIKYMKKFMRDIFKARGILK